MRDLRPNRQLVRVYHQEQGQKVPVPRLDQESHLQAPQARVLQGRFQVLQDPFQVLQDRFQPL